MNAVAVREEEYLDRTELVGFSQETCRFIESVIAAPHGKELLPRILRGERITPRIVYKLSKLLKKYGTVYYDTYFPEELKWSPRTTTEVPKLEYTFYVRRR